MALEENRRLFKHNKHKLSHFKLLRFFFFSKKCNLDHILFIFIHSVIKCKFQRSPILRLHGLPVSLSSGPLHACSYNYYFPLTFQLLTDTLKSVRIVPYYLKDSLQTLAI